MIFERGVSQFGVPDDIAHDYLNVLIIASACASPDLSDDDLDNRVMKLGSLLHGLMKKYLSDSPEVSDKKRFTKALLETALKILNGEIQL